ncbi:uncharacterized protein BHQ10_003280 [Talaromyces amestolkiae]|uniref:NIF system FeS cluster assembly NifU N-terminal domain-containing protein n=1 Tax=Talaromyces amestolkiae TaxID=1196081 RepID=A0A364KUN9_TALAM|nr:uncharacterized protein BHQ10_003280 [Talaromyces amestolkiae]RAO67268.1 hypothetical protein BHQ10_003280 [Talaromyces amestolkiae]
MEIFNSIMCAYAGYKSSRYTYTKNTRREFDNGMVYSVDNTLTGFALLMLGSLDRKSVDVGSGLVGAPACGDVIRLDIQVDEKTGKIVKSAFKTFGCGSAIASSSYLTTLLAGKTLEEAGKIQNTQIANELCLPPVKLHCSLLAEDAIKAAIKNYQSKRPAAAATNLADTSKAFESVAQA